MRILVQNSNSGVTLCTQTQHIIFLSAASSAHCYLYFVPVSNWLQLVTASKKMFIHVNATLDLGQVPDEPDFFAGAYENHLLRYAMASLYLIGLFPCLSLAFVIWFEQSGLAGQYRTVINQLVSIQLIYVIFSNSNF